jgi:predicted DNA-binding transcriptional regulator AlpA
MQEFSKRVLTIPQFCGMYGISRSKFYVMRDAGCCPPLIRLGRQVFIHVDDAEAWVLSFRKPGRAA